MRAGFIAIVTSLLIAGRPAYAGVQTKWSCETKTKTVCSFDITIRGEITETTVSKIKHAMDAREQFFADQEKGVDKLQATYLDSPGGDVAAAIEIGRMFRNANEWVFVKQDEICVSACILVLAGATHRLIYGKVGIHRPYLKSFKGDYDREQVQHAYVAMTEDIRSYLREMNVSEKLADDMMAVEPEEVQYLSISQLTNYGLGIVDPVAKEDWELKQSRKLGISRTEYMRRQETIDALCRSPSTIALNAPVLKSGRLSSTCADAVLAGKHVEKAPSCRSGTSKCRPSEREWGGHTVPANAVISDDGFIITNADH